MNVINWQDSRKVNCCSSDEQLKQNEALFHTYSQIIRDAIVRRSLPPVLSVYCWNKLLLMMMFKRHLRFGARLLAVGCLCNTLHFLFGFHVNGLERTG